MFISYVSKQRMSELFEALSKAVSKEKSELEGVLTGLGVGWDQTTHAGDWKRITDGERAVSIFIDIRGVPNIYLHPKEEGDIAATAKNE